MPGWFAFFSITHKAWIYSMMYTDYVTNKTVLTSQPFPHISKETKTSTKNQNV